MRTDISTLEETVEALEVGGIDIVGQTTVTAAAGDLFLIADVSDSNNFKKVTAQTVANIAINAVSSDITTLQTDVGTLQTDVGTLQTDVDIPNHTTVTPATGDLFLIADVSDSNNFKKVTAQSIINLASTPIVGAAKTLAVSTFTSSDTVTNEDDVVLVNAASGAVTVTLENISGSTGRVLKIKKLTLQIIL